MVKVVKVNGRFILEPDAALLAREASQADKLKLEARPSEEEVLSLLKRILLRLELLEKRL